MIQQIYQEWGSHNQIDFYYIIDNKVVSKVRLEIGDDYQSICSVFTVEQHRGKTYCTQLMKECIKLHNIEIPLYLLVKRDNMSAIRIYKSLGFINHSLHTDTNYEWMIYEKQKQ